MCVCVCCVFIANFLLCISIQMRCARADGSPHSARRRRRWNDRTRAQDISVGRTGARAQFKTHSHTLAKTSSSSCMLCILVCISNVIYLIFTRKLFGCCLMDNGRAVAKRKRQAKRSTVVALAHIPPEPLRPGVKAGVTNYITITNNLSVFA